MGRSAVDCSQTVWRRQAQRPPVLRHEAAAIPGDSPEHGRPDVLRLLVSPHPTGAVVLTGHARGAELIMWLVVIFVPLALAGWILLEPMRRQWRVRHTTRIALALHVAPRTVADRADGDTRAQTRSDSSEPAPVPMPPYTGDPQEDEATIRELLRRSGGWTEWRYPQPGATVRVYVRAREFHADLVVVWTLAYAGACRVAIAGDEDPLVAECAVWHWVGRAVDAVKQICGLTLPPQDGADLRSLPVACRPPSTRPVILRPLQ